MTVFACKALVSEECSICTKPLAVHHNHASPQSILRGFHPTVRIITCGHTHGQECLDNWLDVENSCPTCNRIFFKLTGDPITHEDVSNLVITLGMEYGEGRVAIAVARLIDKQREEHAAIRRYHEQEMAKQKMKDLKKGNGRFTFSDEDLLESDEEMHFGEEDEDEEYVLDEKEPEGSVD